MHIDERNPVQERVDQFAVLFVASMLAEQLFQLKGSISIWMTLFLGLLGVVTLRGLFFQRWLWLLAATFGSYLLSAYFTGQGLGVVRMDVVSILQCTVFSGFVSLSRFNRRRRESFWLMLHRLFILIGAVAGYLGLVKLVLLNRGIQLDFFFTEEGLYPPGSSLNGDYNYFSLGLLLAAGSAIWLLRNDRSQTFFLLAHLALPGIATAMVLTSSRRAIVYFLFGVIVTLVSVVLRWRARRQLGAQVHLKSKGRWLIALTYLFTLAVAVANFDSIRAQISDFIGGQEVQAVTGRVRTLGTEESIAGRTIYWEATERVLERSTPAQLLFGSGFGYVHEMGVIGGVDEDYPHNFLLSAMLYGGALQVLLAVSLVLVGAVSAWRAGPPMRVVAFWIVAFAFFHLTSSNSIFSSELFVITLALAIDASPAEAIRLRRNHWVSPPRVSGPTLI